MLMATASGAVPARPRFPSGLSAQAASYLAVSVLALACDTGVYLALATLGVTPMLAGGTGYALGLLAHYLLSRLFVFDARATTKSSARLFAEFAASGLVGLGLTMAVIAAAVGGLGLALLPAKIAAVGLSFVAVFFIRKYVVFAARR